MSPPLSVLSILRCPHCHASLTPGGDKVVCRGPHPHEFPLAEGIIRFVEPEGARGYSRHWRDYAAATAQPQKLEQAQRFTRWLLDAADYAGESPVILDIGCGDGNHLPFLPDTATKIALDYSQAIDVARARHGHLPNVHFVQADALNLPLGDGAVDMAFSYGCINCVPDMGRAIAEVDRVARPGGTIGLWGWGTRNPILVNGVHVARGINRLLPASLRPYFVDALVPVVALTGNSTDITLRNSSLAACREIVSTNLSPERLHLFHRDTWADFAPRHWKMRSAYDIPCGQVFRREE